MNNTMGIIARLRKEQAEGGQTDIILDTDCGGRLIAVTQLGNF